MYLLGARNRAGLWQDKTSPCPQSFLREKDKSVKFAGQCGASNRHRSPGGRKKEQSVLGVRRAAM